MQGMKKRRQHESDNCHDEQRAAHPREIAIHYLSLVLESARELCGAKDKQEIADDRARNRSFYEVDHTRLKRKTGDDQLREISQSRIQQTTHGGPGVAC